MRVKRRQDPDLHCFVGRVWNDGNRTPAPSPKESPTLECVLPLGGLNNRTLFSL